jgi:integrase
MVKTSKAAPWRVSIYFRWPGSRRPYRERRRAPPEITSKSAAQRWGEAREAYLLAQGEAAALAEKAPDPAPADAPPPVPTLREFAPDWLDKHLVANLRKRSTYITARMILDLHLLPILGDKRLDAIDDEAIASLRSAWLAGSHGERPTSSKKTINNRLSILSTALHVAKKWKRLPAMPCTIELLKVDDQEEADFYEPATYERIVEAARSIDPKIYAAILLAGDAGLRRGEIIALAPGDLALKGDEPRIIVRHNVFIEKGGRETVDTPKGGKAKALRCTSRLADALRALDCRGSRVFGRITPKIVKLWIMRAEKAAGLPETGRVHVYRHTFASHLAMASVPAKTIQGLARHVSIMTTARYMHLSPSAADAGIDALDAWRRGTDEK